MGCLAQKANSPVEPHKIRPVLSPSQTTGAKIKQTRSRRPSRKGWGHLFHLEQGHTANLGNVARSDGSIRLWKFLVMEGGCPPQRTVLWKLGREKDSSITVINSGFCWNTHKL